MIETIHNRNMNHPLPVGTPPKKNGSKIVNLANLDVDSASTSSEEGSRKADTKEDEEVSPQGMRSTAGQARPMVDSHHQLPSLVHGEGKATRVKWIV